LPPERSTPQNSVEQLSLKSVLSSPALRPPALLCATIFIVQQASGVNAVLFYSAKILTSVLPASAGVISVGITVVNAIMTFPPIFLVDVSTRNALVISPDDK
jgi:SP family facilitated glucose transporter-like MFS transporter 3